MEPARIRTAESGKATGPAPRASRLSLGFLIFGGTILFLSFLSGALLWWGGRSQIRELEPPQWMHGWRVFHGALSPVLSILFGALWMVHVRTGWRMNVNRPTGSLMVAIFLGLIISGVGLYYMNSPAAAYWAHVGLGVLLPVGLTLHLWAARRWRKTF